MKQLRKSPDLAEVLEGQTVKGIDLHLDSERGIYEIRVVFEQGVSLSVAPDGFGLRICCEQTR